MRVFLLYFLFVSMSCACMLLVGCAHRGQERASFPLELEFTGSCAGIWASVLLKSSKHSSLVQWNPLQHPKYGTVSVPATAAWLGVLKDKMRGSMCLYRGFNWNKKHPCNQWLNQLEGCTHPPYPKGITTNAASAFSVCVCARACLHMHGCGNEWEDSLGFNSFLF